MNIDNMEKSTDKLFRKIKDTVSDYDFQSLLKVYSDNFNIELLEVLKKEMLHHLEFEKYFYDGGDPKMILKYLSIKVSNNLSIPFIKNNSKEVSSCQFIINDYIQNNVEEIKSYNGSKLETDAIKSPLYKILSDLLTSEIDIKEVFDLDELIYKYEFKNWLKFVELIDEKLNNDPSKKKIETLKWKGSKIEFVELSKALIESDIFNETQKEIVEKLSIFFNIDIKTYDQKLTQIKGRNNGSETLFLNKLKQNLDKYLKK
tara:strand:+ start:75 stop:851 length:777 start_codon:yes stop_codon:yes gene_type:complete